ncbi:DNA polymerase I [Cytobacillus firmus]|uniref:DNA polymerase I n=1 Tax=Cytobacillus firmus TaxID=1399 RepID=A0A380Y0G7_CYTFI|nr:DNA polymerase I [Cytobacillus firmus]KAF0824421.1 DNA polymerase I [Cytobacillus firmus]MBG9541717.1 DNA polymerase I [Cytobacillus firmus]MBG9547519.1 DNA polymerase I [Cytobacillus firmus]MBG9552643.1 DNA polymerase I [Cytobacillus firmus]MBG9556000.1 DNA polymerase I [Cytobacillus firmus]
MDKKKLVLIDGNSIAYRAFFALPLLNNDKGIHTNAVYGFTMMLQRILEDEKPTHLLVAFDAGKTTFRHKTFSEYKGGRQKTPPELSEQFPYIRELLDAYGISRYELENYEADDIIGTLSLHAEKDGYEVKVISGDKDLTQLSSDAVTVSITRKGITDIEEYTPAHIQEKYGITPDRIIDMKGLMGDSSDNIPGVPGVGEKTALKLLKEFGTLEELLDSADKVSGKKLKEKLEEFKDQALMSKELATITREAPVEIKIEDIEYEGFEKEKVISIFKELGFNSLLEKIGGDTEAIEEVLDEIEFSIADEIKEDMFSDENAFYVELLEDNYHYADIIGFSIANDKGNFFFSKDTALESDVFKRWAEDETKKKTVYDAKRSEVSLRHHGIHLKGANFDLYIASYIINPSQTIEDIASIAKNHGYHAIQSDEAFYGKGAKRRIPEETELAGHLARKAAALMTLREKLDSDLKENQQSELFYDLEMPLSLILADMESTGIKVDLERLRTMGQDLLSKLDEIEKRIHELAGEAFNINSPKQLGVILFEKLGLPVIKKTKTGYSTSADVLEKLENDHEIIRNILHYRQLGKLQSTYIEGLLKVVNKETGKVHTRFNQALTQTGRLSSTDPNLQNIPIRLEEGRKIRQAFVPSEPGWAIFAADYSQIELRVLAHIADDEKLIEAFIEDMDIHTKTAMEVFHVNANEVTSNMRRHAKAVNFGIVYGISDYGLSQSLGITRKEAGKFIDRYLESYPGVKQYMDDIIHEAKQKGYVSTLLHRRRYLPEITSRNFNLRSFAERTAMNTPIQGSAADIIKKAMIDMADRLRKEELKARLLLSVHDELIFEAPEDEIKILKKIVPDVMENAVELKVPLKVDYSYGPTWFDAK